MTEKETEIKAIAGAIFDLKEKLSCMGMMNANGSYEERKSFYEEVSLVHYQIEIEEKKLKAASI